MELLKKLKGNLSWAFLVWVCTLAQQFGFQYFKGMALTTLPVEKFFIGFGFFFLFSFIKNNFTRFLLSSFIIIMGYFQLAHLSFYGTQILPIEIWLLFAEMGEVVGTLKEEIIHIVLPILFTVPFLSLLFWSSKRIKVATLPFIPLLFALYFFYNPIRTMVTGNTWGRQPSTQELYGMNTYLSLSYFLGKILPSKILGTNKVESGKLFADDLKFGDKKISKYKNIVFILGESLTPAHMSLFGYPKETTPYLNSIKENQDFYYGKAVAGGVSTDIAVAFFMNATYGTSGQKVISKGERCFFKMAKNNYFDTYFFSVQSGQQLRYITPYICPEFIEDYRALEQMAPEIEDANAAPDRILLPELKKVLEKKGEKYIVLHMRGSHSPYSLRYSPESKKITGGDERVDDYDNSVVEFDTFMKEAIEVVKPHLEDTILIYVSDHGEGLGEEGVWGHGPLLYPSYVIPFLVYADGAKAKTESVFKQNEFLTNFNISLFIYHLMGVETSIKPHQVVPDFQVYGNDLDGFAGHVKVPATFRP